MAERLIKRGKVWYYRYTDASGRRVREKGCEDRRVTEEMRAAAVTREGRIREGVADPKEFAYKDHEQTPLSIHVAAWAENLVHEGDTKNHVSLSLARASRIVAM